MNEPKIPTKHWESNPDPSSIVVPGVDAAASVNDQIDQIDQLITIRLQNIDANFSRIQHLISTKLLPAFKRYAESTAPVREAAKFWKSFYETAAQVRMPIASDTSSFLQTDEESEDNIVRNEPYDRTPTDVNLREDSFAHGAPISSTPLVRDHVTKEGHEDDDSWAASIESPFERLARHVKDLGLDEVNQLQGSQENSSAPSFSPLYGTYPGLLPSQRDAQSSHQQTTDAPMDNVAQLKRPHHKDNSPLRQDPLRQNHAPKGDSGGTSFSSLPTPRRNKTPKNPFLAPNSSSRQWNGIVDLRQPSPARSRALRTPTRPGSRGRDDCDPDSSDDLFPPGMSPPVTMQFAMAARRASPTKLALTPARKAAERIGHDLVAGVAGKRIGLHRQSKASGGEPSLSSVAPSLPSLTRYSVHRTDPGLASPAEMPGLPGEFITPTNQIYYPPLREQPPRQVAEPSQDRQNERPYSIAAPSSPRSDSDTDSSEHSESNPSAGFLFATQNNARAQADDSFASSQQSDEDEDEAARAAGHPLAHMFVGGPQGVEDSFDQDESFALEEEETVFGARQVGQGGQGRLTIRHDALIADTHTEAVSLNPFAQIEQSPTPYVGNATPLG